MVVLIHTIGINTKSTVEFLDITNEVQRLVQSSSIERGVCHIFVPHTTAAVIVNEHADPSVVQDIASQLDTFIPQHSGYRHREGNSPAHIKASLLGNSEIVLIENGKLVLGTWQGIFFCEFDGPRSRNLLIKLVSD
jgi:secondary thiamine-phosphate synthase enzyme